MRNRKLRGRDRERYLEARDEAIDDFLVAGRRRFDMLGAEMEEQEDLDHIYPPVEGDRQRRRGRRD